jgi:hypothetical protein
MAEVIGFDDSVKKSCVCRHCSAIIEYLPIDMKSYHGRDYGGGPDGREWIVCPNCHKDVTLRSW